MIYTCSWAPVPFSPSVYSLVLVGVNKWFWNTSVVKWDFGSVLKNPLKIQHYLETWSFCLLSQQDSNFPILLLWEAHTGVPLHSRGGTPFQYVPVDLQAFPSRCWTLHRRKSLFQLESGESAGCHPPGLFSGLRNVPVWSLLALLKKIKPCQRFFPLLGLKDQAKLPAPVRGWSQSQWPRDSSSPNPRCSFSSLWCSFGFTIPFYIAKKGQLFLPDLCKEPVRVSFQ